MYDLVIENKSENQFIFHPRFHHLIPEIDRVLNTHQITGQFCLMSSGTTSNGPKGYALSFDSLINSAKAVNERLNLTRQDRWGLTLPPYHIAGLSIYLRSLLLDQRQAVLHPWDPTTLASKIIQENVTGSSLVPTQIHDLVTQNTHAPQNLKAVLVGGDFFGEELEIRSKALGWPVVRTFGMTEVASGLALGGNLSDGLKTLPHHEIKVDDSKNIWVKSQSLFTCEFKLEDKWQIKFPAASFDDEGYYPLPDKAELTTDGMIPLGRNDESFKSSSHLISLAGLKNMLDRFMLENSCWGKMDFILTPDDRKGKILTLIYEEQISPEILLKLDKTISPVRIEIKQKVSLLKKTELGKTIL